MKLVAKLAAPVAIVGAMTVSYLLENALRGGYKDNSRTVR